MHPAHRKPQAARDFGVRKEAVDGRRFEGREPQVQRLEAEGVAQLLAKEEAAHHPLELLHRPGPDQQPGIPQAEEVAPAVDIAVHEPV
jgi:hypothetical protein